MQTEFPNFQNAFKVLENSLLNRCSTDWKKSFAGLALNSNTFGNTTILPPLFNDHNGNQMDSTHRSLVTGGGTWRQLFTVAGNQTLMSGAASGHTIPENFKVGLMGFAFPNKNQNITEIKMQIGDRKFGRINIEEIHQYECPALVFEEGYEINEEESFDLYGYVEGPIPIHIGGYTGVWQRIVPLGMAYFKYYDAVGGAPGSAISIT